MARAIRDLKVYPMFGFTIIDTEKRGAVECRVARSMKDEWQISLRQSDNVISLGDLSDEKFNALLISLFTRDSDFAKSAAAAVKVIFEKYKDSFEL